MACRNSVRSSYKFVAEPPDELLCLICLEVARDPLQHEACGKLFCEECIDEHGRNKPCPNCREDHSSYYLDKRSKSLIVNVCVNIGCVWGVASSKSPWNFHYQQPGEWQIRIEDFSLIIVNWLQTSSAMPIVA